MARIPKSLWIVIIGFSLFHASGGEAAVRFGTAFKTNPLFVLPALAALENGYWSELGIEVKWIPFDSGTTTVRGIAAKEVDVGTLGLNTIILSVSRGLPIIAAADPGISTPFNFWVKANSRIRKPEDLKGAKIGVPVFGSESHAYAVATIRALGLEKEVKFISIGSGAPQLAGLISGAIDVTNANPFSMAGAKVKGEVRQLLNVSDHLPAEYAHFQMTFSTPDFLSKQSEAVKKAHRGFIKGEEFLAKNRAWILEKLKTEFRYSEDAAQVVHPVLTYAPKPRIERKRIEGAIRFLVEFGLLKKEQAPFPEKVYVEGFTP